jgi:hypothetical protein
LRIACAAALASASTPRAATCARRPLQGLELALDAAVATEQHLQRIVETRRVSKRLTRSDLRVDRDMAIG